MNNKRIKNLMLMVENEHKINTGRNLFEQEFDEGSLSEFIDFLMSIKDSVNSQITFGEFLEIVKANKSNFSNWLSKNSYSNSSNNQTSDEWYNDIIKVINDDPVLNGLYKQDKDSGYENAKYFSDWVNLINDKVLPYYKEEALDDIKETLEGEGFNEEEADMAQQALKEIYEGDYQERVLKTDFNNEKVAFYFPYKDIIEGEVKIDFNFINDSDENIVKNFLSETGGSSEMYNEFINTDAHKMYKNKVLISSDELSEPTVISKTLLLPVEFKRQADVILNHQMSNTILNKLIGNRNPDKLIDKVADIEIDKDKIEDFLQQRGLGVKNSKDVTSDEKSDKIHNIELALSSSERNSVFVKIIDTIINDFDKSISIDISGGKIQFNNLERIDSRTFKTKEYLLKLKEQYKKSYDFTNVEQIQFVDTTQKMVDYLRRNVDNIEYDKKQKNFTTPGIYYNKGMIILNRKELNG